MDCTTTGVVRVSMKDCIEKMLKEFHADKKRKTKTPAGDDLFKINDKAEQMKPRDKD